MASLTSSSAWQGLAQHSQALARVHLAELLARPERFARFSCCELDLLVDFSRQHIDEQALALLLELARARDVEGRRDAMFAGEPINATEGRAVLHVALRNLSGRPILVDGSDVMVDVRAELDHMRRFVGSVHTGAVHGSKGRSFEHVVNIGIGGSDLGIVMATEALARYRNREIELHCVSNIDGVQLADVLERVEVERTLFVICSKTFTTLETLTNARLARDWLAARLGEQAVPQHFVAVSTNHPAMDEFGIAPDRRFTMWDWVGGRYSLWSAVGLSIALALGMDTFELMLEGAHLMDEHFRSAPLDRNLPVLKGLIDVWNRNFERRDSLAVLPYDQRLHRLPAYLQQLEMESNGKRVTLAGEPVDYDTGPVLWGEPGSNAQHSFFQLLHQGTARVALDFLAPVNASSVFQQQQDLALANCFAQAQAFAVGQSAADVRADLTRAGMEASRVEQLVPHKVHPGNTPSTLMLFPRLGPRTLGKLIALYEHSVFVQGVIWGINSFDQWGVELGKRLASTLAPAVTDPATGAASAPEIRDLLGHVARWRARTPV